MRIFLILSVFLLSAFIDAVAQTPTPEPSITPTIEPTVEPSPTAQPSVPISTATPIVVAKPNILWIITDDQRFDQMKYMPKTQSLFSNKGIDYSFAHVSTALCCPSRSAMYTGQYNSKNGVLHNRYRLVGSTIFDDLSPTYYTGLVGKYLNTWDIGRPLPTLDWSAVVPRGTAKFFKQTYLVNGQVRHINRSNSQQVVDYGLEFLDKASKQNEPYFLVLAFAAPHFPAKPDPKDIGRFKSEKIKRYPSYKKKNLYKPKYVLNNAKKFDKFIKNDVNFQKRQSDTLYSLDRALTRLYSEIDFSNTMVIFMSDNGLMHGEHGLFSKAAPYEESTKVPMFIRYDPLIDKHYEYKNLVAHLDLTATAYSLAGVTPTRQIDGVSLEPTFRNNSDPVRENLLLEGWRDHWKATYRSNYMGILTNDRLKLVRNENDRSEVYDLNRDQYEMHNLFYKPAEQTLARDMERKLDDLLMEVRGHTGWE